MQHTTKSISLAKDLENCELSMKQKPGINTHTGYANAIVVAKKRYAGVCCEEETQNRVAA